MHAYSLLVTDIDGTLLDNHGRLPPENIAALRQWVDSGRSLALATGRSWAIAQPIAQAIDRQLFLILQDGGLVMHAPSMRVLSHYNLPADVSAGAQAVFRAADMPVIGFGPLPDNQAQRLTVLPFGPLSAGMRQYLQAKAYRQATRHNGGPAAFSKLVALDSLARVEPVAARLTDALPQARVTTTEAVRLGAWFLEVGHPLASKLHGLHTLLAELNRPATQVIAIGDADNDTDILREAGLGVAMGNASARVRRAADRVIGLNAEAGVAAFLRQVMS